MYSSNLILGFPLVEIFKRRRNFTPNLGVQGFRVRNSQGHKMDALPAVELGTLLLVLLEPILS